MAQAVKRVLASNKYRTTPSIGRSYHWMRDSTLMEVLLESGGGDPRMLTTSIDPPCHPPLCSYTGPTRLLRRAAKAPGGRGRSAPRPGGSPKSARFSGPPAVTGSALYFGHHIVAGRRGRAMFALGVGGVSPHAPGVGPARRSARAPHPVCGPAQFAPPRPRPAAGPRSAADGGANAEGAYRPACS